MLESYGFLKPSLRRDIHSRRQSPPLNESPLLAAAFSGKEFYGISELRQSTAKGRKIGKGKSPGLVSASC